MKIHKGQLYWAIEKVDRDCQRLFVLHLCCVDWTRYVSRVGRWICSRRPIKRKPFRKRDQMEKDFWMVRPDYVAKSHGEYDQGAVITRRSGKKYFRVLPQLCRTKANEYMKDFMRTSMSIWDEWYKTVKKLYVDMYVWLHVWLR